MQSWEKASLGWDIEDMIENYITKNDTELLWYYFWKQIDKQDASHFLYALIVYIKKSGAYSHLLKKIDTDLNGLSNNNFLPKYIIDSYLIALK